MKRAILLVDHGSRREEANQLLGRVAEAVRERRPDEIVEIAHMEIAAPTISDGISTCVGAGADSIVIYPYFLGPGLHTQQTIPELVEAAAAAFPQLQIRIAEPLGLHAGVIDAVMTRVDEAG